MNKKGQMIMVNLLILTMSIAILIAVIPMMNSVLNIGKQSDNLNCAGYKHDNNATDPLSYNSTYNQNTLACIAIGLYVPYIVLAMLIGGVTMLLGGRMFDGGGGQQQY